ncbi:MAG: hypothetical protein WBE37_06590 [Bryobacteraceae bacterium]
MRIVIEISLPDGGESHAFTDRQHRLPEFAPIVVSLEMDAAIFRQNGPGATEGQSSPRLARHAEVDIAKTAKQGRCCRKPDRK